LKATFDQDTALAPIGGAEYPAKLAGAGAPLTRVEVQDYARLVYDHWQRRQLIEFGEEVVGTLDNSASAQIERAESWLYRLAESGMPSFSAACNLAWRAKMPFSPLTRIGFVEFFLYSASAFRFLLKGMGP
jgi:replicative DNA helicase